MELLHIVGKKRKQGNPAVTVELPDGSDLTVTPVPVREKVMTRDQKERWTLPALRWLGFYFDRGMTWERHVQERCSSALRVANHLRSLASTKNGPPPHSMRKAVATVVLPSVLYGAEVWYRGQKKLTRMVHRVMCAAAKAVLPTWCTTPHTVLLRDPGLPAAEVALRHAQARLAYRLGTVHASNPMVARASERPKAPDLPPVPPPRPPSIHRYELRERLPPLPQDAPTDKAEKQTRLQWLASLLPAFPRPEPTGPRWTEGSKSDLMEGMTKKKAAKAFSRWCSALEPWDTVIFSDGSELTDENGAHRVGYGYAVMRNDELVAYGNGALHPTSHVFDAEAVGVLRGLEAAVALQDGSQLWSCVDSTSVIHGLRGTASTSSQWAFLEYQALASRYNARIKWSPGHEGIEGNEHAHRLADAGARGRGDEPTGMAAEPSLSGVRSIMKGIQRKIAA